MPISITALKAGDVVYDARRERMGNTTMFRMGVWQVQIIEVDAEAGRVTASWNNNAPRVFRARRGKLPWRRTKPAAKKSI